MVEVVVGYAFGTIPQLLYPNRLANAPASSKVSDRSVEDGIVDCTLKRQGQMPS